MLVYRARLNRDLDRWQDAGWLTVEGAAAIRGELASRRGGFGLAQVLGTLASLLIGFAAMSFVAANWQEMSKLARLAVIFGAMWVLFALAAVLFRRGLDRFGHAALLGAAAIFGAGIMLIAQMYHMDGHPPDAVLLWGAGTLLAGLLTRSNPVLAAALVLFCVWSIMEMTSGVRIFGGWDTQVHWPFLPAWVAVAAGFAWTRWRTGLHLLAVALAGWVIMSGYMVGKGNTFGGHFAVLIAGLAAVGLSVGAGDVIDRWRRISAALLGYGLVVAYAGGFALQFFVDGISDRVMLNGVVALAAVLAALAWAWRMENRPALWISYAAFTAEIMALYVKKIGTLLGTSAFFLLTGLVVAGLAYAAYRLHEAEPRRRGAA